MFVLSVFPLFMYVSFLAGILCPNALGGSGGMRPGRTSCNHPNPLFLVVLVLFIVVSCLTGIVFCLVAVLFVVICCVVVVIILPCLSVFVLCVLFICCVYYYS